MWEHDRDAALAGGEVGHELRDAAHPGSQMGGNEPPTRRAGDEEQADTIRLMTIAGNEHCRLSDRPFHA